MPRRARAAVLVLALALCGVGASAGAQARGGEEGTRSASTQAPARDGAAAYAASGADARRTGRSRARAPKARPKLLWSVRLSGRRLVPPAVLASGRLLIGSRSGLHALDPETGRELWFAAIGAVRHTPVVLDGDDVIAVGGGRVYRVDPRGGQRPLAPGLRAAIVPPLLEGPRVVVVGHFEDAFEDAPRPDVPDAPLAPSSRAPAPPPPAHLVALSLGGELLSATALGLEQPRLLASVAPGLALVAGRDDVVSRAPTDGFGARAIDLGDAVSSIVIGARGEAFLITESDQLVVLEPSGERRRIAPGEPRAITVGPALGRDGALRIGLENGELMCIGPDGGERWRRGVDGRPGPILLDRDDTALFATSRGTLYAIDRGGELRWLLPAEALRAARPVLSRDGTLFIVSRGGLVAAYR